MSGSTYFALSNVSPPMAVQVREASPSIFVMALDVSLADSFDSITPPDPVPTAVDIFNPTEDLRASRVCQSLKDAEASTLLLA